MAPSRCLIFTVADGYEPAELTVPVWQDYAARYGHAFAVVRHPRGPGLTPHWDRYHVFSHHPDYDRYLYVDADTLPHWDCPDIFERVPDPGSIHAVADAGGLGWIRDSLDTYGPLFDGLRLPWEHYVNSGVLLFSQHHRALFKRFLRFRSRSWTALQRQLREARRLGRMNDEGDQTLFNLFLHANASPPTLLPQRWNLQHIVWRGGLHHDAYLRMGHILHFCGLDQARVVEQVRHTLARGSYGRHRPATASPVADAPGSTESEVP